MQSPIGYSIGMLLLILLLVFYSREYYVQTGAKSWLQLVLTFQPVEVMKPLYILMMGRLIVQDQQWGPHNNFNADWRLTRRLDFTLFQLLLR